MPTNPARRVTANLTLRQIAFVQAEAKRLGVSESAVVRYVLDAYQDWRSAMPGIRSIEPPRQSRPRRRAA